jgi:3-keto-disaccharide hydrolase
VSVPALPTTLPQLNRLYVITTGLLVGLTVLGCAYMSFGQSDAGWTTLIDGATGLDNWTRVGDANWRTEDGAIVADKGKGGFLVSKSSYKDFQIRAEFWADHTTNSGIFIRCAEPDKITATNALRGEHLRPAPRPVLRDRRDRQRGQGLAHAQSRRQMEHV